MKNLSVTFVIVNLFLLGCQDSISVDGENLKDIKSQYNGSNFSGVVAPIADGFALNQSCDVSSANVYLYELTDEGKKVLPALAETSLDSSAQYNFENLELPQTDSVKYLVEVIGCESVYSRFITSYNDNQNINMASTLLTFTNGVNLNKKFSKIKKKDLEETETFLAKYKSLAMNDIYEKILANKDLSKKFQEVFSDDGILKKLKYSQPKFGKIVVPTTLLENQAHEFSAASYHWAKPKISYAWFIDGKLISKLSTFEYTPGFNDQGEHTLLVRISINGNKSSEVVYRERVKSFTVENSVLPMPPAYEIANNTTNASLVTLTLKTGSKLSGGELEHCRSFDALAVSVGRKAQPPKKRFNIVCKENGSQLISDVALTPGDGLKVIRLWAIDSSGTISKPRILNVIVDKGLPTASISQPTVVPGGQTYSLSTTASDASSGVLSKKLYFAADGVNFSLVGSVSSGSTSWQVPTIDTTSAVLKLVVVDNAGNSKSVVTSAFTIDSTKPNAPSVSLLSASNTNATTLNYQVSSCSSGIDYILYNSGATPLASDSDWVSCTTSSQSLTISDTSNGTKNWYFWSKDTSGNISATSDTLSMYFDNVQPSISVATPTNGSGGDSQNLSFTVTEVNADTTLSFVLEYYDGSSWNSIGTQALTQNSHSGTSVTYSWASMPAIDTASAKVRVSLTDLAGNLRVAESGVFKIDSSGPVISTYELNNNSSTSTTTIIPVSLSGTDAISEITDYCLTINQSVAPASTDSCWNAVTPTVSLSLSYAAGVTINTGMVAGEYKVYVWLKDSFDNISTNSDTLGVDRFDINFNPGTPPSASDLIIANTDSPSQPVASSELVFTTSDPVYIKWNAADAEGLTSTPISLYYSTDDTVWTLISDSLVNGQNGACTVNHAGTAVDDTATGCYLLPTAPSNSFFRVKVKVVDETDQVASIQSTPANVSGINFLGGNTDPGHGSSAKNGVLFNVNLISYSTDAFSLVVTESGIVYFRDANHGVLRIDPNDGILEKYIPTTGTQSGDGGQARDATLKVPSHLALDNQDRLLIYDYNRIRRVDNSTGIITTIIGGGSLTSDSLTNPLDLKLSNLSSLAESRDYNFLVSDGNGNLFFTTTFGNNKTPANGAKIRRYSASTGQITSITPNGVGYNSSGVDVSTCNFRSTTIRYDVATGDATEIFADACGGPLLIDAVTGTAHPTLFPPKYNSGSSYYTTRHFTGKDGKIYAYSRQRSRVDRYDEGTNSWVPVFGTSGSPSCADGTPVLSCKVNIMTPFVDKYGKVYVVERGFLRTSDSSGNVITIAGQARDFGEATSPLNARFGLITDFEVWNDGGTDKVIVLDNLSGKLREFSTASGGLIQTLSGGGTNGQLPGKVATSTKFNNGGTYYDQLTADANGNVYTQAGGRSLKLNRSTGNWDAFTGGGGTYYHDGDGLVGTSLKYQYGAPTPIGANATHVLLYAARHYSPLSHNSSAYKLHSLTDGTQSHLAGVTGVAVSNSWCADGINTADCVVFGGTSRKHLAAQYDSYTPRWILGRNGDANIKIFEQGGTIATLANVGQNVASFAYRHDATHNILYLCSSTDSKLYKYNVATSTLTALDWPIASMSCKGKALHYSASRNSIIFSYERNGLYGIAEYLNP